MGIGCDAMSRAERLLLCTVTDQNYLYGACVWAASVLQSTSRRQVDVAIFTLDVDRGRRSSAESSVPGPVSVMPLPAQEFAGLNHTGRLSRAAFGRFMIPAIVRGRYDFAVYMDADAVVVRDMMPALHRIDLKGKSLGAVRDLRIRRQSEATLGTSGVYSARRLGEYFNSGVLVLDVESLCAQGFASQLKLIAAANHGRQKYPDQDSLNAYFGDNWARMPYSWNRTVPVCAAWRQTAVRARLLAQHPYVVHFTGPVKPWESGYPSGSMKRLYQRFSSTVRTDGPE